MEGNHSPYLVAGLSHTSRLSAGSFRQTMCSIVTHEATDGSACHVYLFHVCKTFMCVWGFCKTAPGLSDSKNHQRKRIKLHKKGYRGQISQLAGMRKNAAFQMLSSATHKDIPRQLHVLMRSWLSIDQSALMWCGQGACDKNLENGKCGLHIWHLWHLENGHQVNFHLK